MILNAEITESDKLEILSELRDEEFVPLNGLVNIWCGSIHVDHELMLLNLVKTDDKR